MSTQYIVIASTEMKGDYRREAQLSAEFLGEAYGKRYATREEAEGVAAELQEGVAEYGLDPSTRYEVEEA